MDNSINEKLSVAFSKFVRRNETKITVSNLCQKANVARATFYLHYKNIDDFIAENREGIVIKLFEQMKIIFMASDSELCEVLKRKNIIFEDYEIDILRYFTSGSLYIDFSITANEQMLPLYKALIIKRWGEDYYNSKASFFQYFLNGFVPILYFDLLDYDEAKIQYDMRFSREIVAKLFPEVIKDIRKGNKKM